MKLEGTAVVIDLDSVDTDVMYPGQFLGILDDAEMATHLFEGLDPSLRDQLVGETILVAGANFGTGSSRENVPAAMRAAGIRCVIAKSFARIFQRNCFNLGLPAISSPDAVAATRTGTSISVDVQSGAIAIDGQEFQATPLPPFMVELVGCGGLVPWIRERHGANEKWKDEPRA
jgi:3-isopropylmalate dehydratase small subunit